MKVIWINKKSILTSGKKKFKAGDIIPGGLLTASRIDELVKAKKIKIEGEEIKSKNPEPEIKSEKPEKFYETKKASVKKEKPSLIDEESKYDEDVEEIDLGI